VVVGWLAGIKSAELTSRRVLPEIVETMFTTCRSTGILHGTAAESLLDVYSSDSGNHIQKFSDVSLATGQRKVVHAPRSAFLDQWRLYSRLFLGFDALFRSRWISEELAIAKIPCHLMFSPSESVIGWVIHHCEIELRRQTLLHLLPNKASLWPNLIPCWCFLIACMDHLHKNEGYGMEGQNSHICQWNQFDDVRRVPSLIWLE
jgi:hypothetical protein